MKYLPLPQYGARATFEFCVESVRDLEFAQRLRSVACDIEAAEANYFSRAQTVSLCTIAVANDVRGIVNGSEMKSLYKGTLSRKGARQRQIYDAIMTTPEHGICPLCGQRDVSTLDHYLALSLHPAFAVAPLNLVPACQPCNKAKLDRQPMNASEQTLHPYFDDVGDMVWLKAQVIEQAMPALVFSVEPPEVCPQITRERLNSHFLTFKLGALYSTHAAVELIHNRLILMQIAGRVGVDGFRSHLLEQADSRRAIDQNSWQCAMYDALATSEWFCREGYQAIR